MECNFKEGTYCLLKSNPDTKDRSCDGKDKCVIFKLAEDVVSRTTNWITSRRENNE